MKKGILFVIIFICLLPILTSAKDLDNENDILLSMLNHMGGHYLEEDFSANGILMDKFLSEEELDNLGNDLVKYFGLLGQEGAKNTELSADSYVKEKIIDDSYRQINYFGFDKSSNPLTIIISSYLNEETGNGQTYLYINLIKKEQFNKINDIMIGVKNLFEKYERNVEITTCLIGYIDGKLSKTEINDISLKSLHNLSCKIVDEYEDSQLVSYTAYTESIEDYILAGDDRINLNVALRYNEYDNQTLIWIGTPIITSGY
ncbi:YwmB family TATA-box binding protein [Tissierella sp. Yu-01]|uniref:YwmB family TATA-box binding protein n=1 Tax=Tissierella sp. Yu-01 TaxID=3035694 RepID=UPI00240E7D3C|nr:YwmB family TATA-box binding protein [Tissierella sp. Yu-01]WFA08689.1 YwmB family TATA-box binding protein [Tissierella sp. Yu-01]